MITLLKMMMERERCQRVGKSTIWEAKGKGKEKEGEEQSTTKTTIISIVATLIIKKKTTKIIIITTITTTTSPIAAVQLSAVYNN